MLWLVCISSKAITMVLGGAKPRKQQQCLCKIVSGELVLVEHLHMGKRALALKWLNRRKSHIKM